MAKKHRKRSSPANSLRKAPPLSPLDKGIYVFLSVLAFGITFSPLIAALLLGDRVSFSEMMKIAREQQAMFVTPNDLVNNVTNAKCVGMLKAERYGDKYDDNWKK
jgi:hypothetical protein